MQFINIAAFAICVVTNQVMAVAVAGPEVQELVARQGRPVAFNVAPQGAACGTGTTISCSPSTTSPCKGNFNPAQASIVVTEAAGNCHAALGRGILNFHSLVYSQLRVDYPKTPFCTGCWDVKVDCSPKTDGYNG
ncbi:hypothetical protein BDZ97DRAFT_1955759 [Flammula alnicola]|nr:hypothetical protein BDZ97DRAFT_1955759 [Flammula alnicola]